jgi:hypothetical protein
MQALLASPQTKCEPIAAITSILAKKLAADFGRPEGVIDIWLALTDIGVDSLIAVEHRNRIGVMMDADCSIFDIMQSPLLSILVETMASKSRLVRSEIR